MLDDNSKSENLRDFLRQYFQNRPSLDVCSDSDLLKTLRDFANESGVECPIRDYNECSRVMPRLWDMVMERIIEPRWSGGLASHITGFGLTEYGQKLLEGLPIDRPNQYLDYLRSRVQNIDPQIIVYVRESLISYNRGCYFATTVMLGVASETLFELLIDAYAKTIQDQVKQESFRRKMERSGISQQYNEFKKKLPDLVGRNGITAGDRPSTTRFRQEFKHAIEITFDTLRSYRDYAAHPRDGEVPRHIIMCNLNAFPLFCQRLYQAIEWLKRKV